MLEISQGWLSFCLLAIVPYITLVRALRYRRSKIAQKKFPNRASYGSMTLDDAFEIQSRLAEVEFPTVFSVSVFFALFKTYGIPSISKLLAQTGQLANSSTASKRATDTGVILTEVVLHHPTSSRAIDGIARMNYLHSIYRKAGKISDVDMLYTLSLFALEPIRWTKRFEWREVNEVERCAMGTYWRFLGEAMEIPYIMLKSHKSGWTDGLHFLDELTAWSESYEASYMLPAQSNHIVVRGTIDIGLYKVPRFLHKVYMPFVAALIQPHVRKAMLLNDPHPYASKVLDLVVGIRKFLLRHFFLPRPYFLRKRWWSEHPNASGRFNSKRSVALPWYIKPSFYARWGPKALILRLSGCKVPGDDGTAYMPDGYIISQLGPEQFKHRGAKDMEVTRKRLANSERLGCPFTKW